MEENEISEKNHRGGHRSPWNIGPGLLESVCQNNKTEIRMGILTQSTQRTQRHERPSSEVVSTEGGQR